MKQGEGEEEEEEEEGEEKNLVVVTLAEKKKGNPETAVLVPKTTLGTDRAVSRGKRARVTGCRAHHQRMMGGGHHHLHLI